MRTIDLFAGIGGMRLPFDRLGYRCVFSSEINPYARLSYETYFGDEPAGDIRSIPTQAIPDHDLLLAGFPCQPYSAIGRKKGLKDPRAGAFDDIVRVLTAKRPRAFLLENVPRIMIQDRGAAFRKILDALDGLGYSLFYHILNTLDFGLPQRRLRLFIVGLADPKARFDFPVYTGRPYDLNRVLQPADAVDWKRFKVTPSIYQRAVDHLRTYNPQFDPTPIPGRPTIWHTNIGKGVAVHPYACSLLASAGCNYLLVDGQRRLTPRELFRFQGFPDDYRIVVSLSRVRQQTGNAVSVPVVAAIARALNHTLQGTTHAVGWPAREQQSLFSMEELYVA